MQPVRVNHVIIAGSAGQSLAERIALSDSRSLLLADRILGLLTLERARVVAEHRL